MLQRAMDEVGISAKDVFVTNAVKHFKFVPRGKFRLHQSPRMSEISACRPWLEAELDAVKPKVILCLGASAAKSLLGGTFALMAQRGKMQTSKYAERVLATVHPSAVLRAQDDAGRELLYGYLRDDLAVAWDAVQRVG
jgi:DNA polymerase